MKMEELPTNEAWSADDWLYVFEPCDYTSGIELRYMPLGGGQAQPAPADTPRVTVDDVAEVTHWHGESPEGWGSLDMAALMRLTDGRWAAVSAWADTSGWGCRDAVEITIGTRDDLVAYGFGDEHRRNLEIEP